LPEGQEPEILEFDVHHDADFNDFDFGVQLPEGEQ
jgi:hypothetical protein